MKIKCSANDIKKIIMFTLFKVLDREGQMDNPCTQWLTETSWDNITELDKYVPFFY